MFKAIWVLIWVFICGLLAVADSTVLLTFVFMLFIMMLFLFTLAATRRNKK